MRCSGEVTADDREAFERLEFRLRSILPQEYQDTYQDVQPVSMGSAGLKFDANGQVAWNEIWGSFCDLAMAGGPPHKGALLRADPLEEITADPIRYQDVVAEICRGITMASDLPAEPSPETGWVRVDCYSEAMAGWLVRAIAMENVDVRVARRAIELPAGPRYRLEKEIKNVVTVVAKTAHYWMGHMPRSQRQAIAVLLAQMDKESPLVVPGTPGETTDGARRVLLTRLTGLRTPDLRPAAAQPYPDWIGVSCPSVQAAVWTMRLLVALNVLSRREDTVLFLPVNADIDPGGDVVVAALTRVRELAHARRAFDSTHTGF